MGWSPADRIAGRGVYPFLCCMVPRGCMLRIPRPRWFPSGIQRQALRPRCRETGADLVADRCSVAALTEGITLPLPTLRCGCAVARLHGGTPPPHAGRCSSRGEAFRAEPFTAAIDRRADDGRRPRTSAGMPRPYAVRLMTVMTLVTFVGRQSESRVPWCFAEISPGKWPAGSSFVFRSHLDYNGKRTGCEGTGVNDDTR
jgi:hypothetical protein